MDYSYIPAISSYKYGSVEEIIIHITLLKNVIE